jgi:hypothetical protein
MFKGQKNRLLFKNTNNWYLGLNEGIYKCNKCHKYNTIIKITDKTLFQLCLFCGNPNYIYK